MKTFLKDQFFVGSLDQNLAKETIKKGTKPVKPPKPKKPATIETVQSAKSTTAFHSTLFRKFNLDAEATYNYYVDDEDKAPTSDLSGSLADVPRYVTLRWNTAPAIVQKADVRKGTRLPTYEKPTRTSKIAVDLAASSLANGYLSAGTISTLLVDPTSSRTKVPKRIDEDSFLLARSSAGKFAADSVGKVTDFSVSSRTTSRPESVVKFVDPSIAGVFDTNRLASSTDPFHLAIAGALSPILGSLEVLSEFNQDVSVQNPAPNFVGSTDDPVTMYVGYLIERYDVHKDGSLTLGRTIVIPDPAQNEFIDQQVIYGGSYAYRIRTIVQWTRPSNVDFAGPSTIDRPTELSSLISPPRSSFYAGDWSDWSRTEVLDTLPPEPPVEVIVRPVSWKGEMHVAWRVGNDPQRDISAFRLVRAVLSSGRLSDWKQLGEYPVANGLYIDRDVQPYESGNISYIYALYSTSFHGVDSPLSDQMEGRLSLADSREELPVNQITIAGVDRTEHASAGLQPDPTSEVKANKRLMIYCRSSSSGHPLRHSKYLIEVRSLSTGERRTVIVDADATDMSVTDA